MPTEIFTIKEFEDALPCHKDTQDPLWLRCSDFSEYSYILPVKPEVDILITSSIRRGMQECDGTGENSIRCWLVDSVTRAPMGPKTQRWIARTRNWRTNLHDNLHELYRIGLKLGPCKRCKGVGVVKMFKVKKEGPTKGKLFLSCSTKNCVFEWVET